MSYYDYNHPDDFDKDLLLKLDESAGYAQFKKEYNEINGYAPTSLKEEFLTSDKKPPNLLKAEKIIDEIISDLNENSANRLVKTERMLAQVFEHKLKEAMQLIANEFGVKHIEYYILAKHGNPINFEPKDFDGPSIIGGHIESDNKLFYSPISPIMYLDSKNVDLIYEKGRPKFASNSNYRMVMDIEIRAISGVLTGGEFVAGVCTEILNHIFVKAMGTSYGMFFLIMVTMMNTGLLLVDIENKKPGIIPKFGVIKRFQKVIVVGLAIHRLIFGESVNKRFRRVISRISVHLNRVTPEFNNIISSLYNLMYFFKYSKFIYDVLFVPLSVIVKLVVAPALLADVYIPKFIALMIRFLKRYFVGSFDVTNNDVAGNIYKNKVGAIEYVDTCVIQRGYAKELISFLDKSRIPALAYNNTDEERSTPTAIAITSISNIYTRLMMASWLNLEDSSMRSTNARKQLNDLKNKKGIHPQDKKAIEQSLREIDEIVEKNRDMISAAHFKSKTVEKIVNKSDELGYGVAKFMSHSHESMYVKGRHAAKNKLLKANGIAPDPVREKKINEISDMIEAFTHYTYEVNEGEIPIDECRALVEANFPIDLPIECMTLGKENILL